METLVSKDRLLAILEDNRSAHRSIFEQALEAYKSQALAGFEKRIERIRAGKDFDIHLRLPVPEDHTDDYDRIIRMVNLSVEENIALSESDIAKYVMDDWQWKQAWITNTASYTGK